MRKFGKTDTSLSKRRGAPSKDGGIKSSIKRNWLPLTLGLTVLIALITRTIFSFGLSAGDGFALSGSSAAEHKHTIVGILTGTFGLSDPSFNYPYGGALMQPPLIDIILAGFAWIPMALGVSASTAAAGVLAFSGPIAAAITVPLVYILGKEMFDRNIGVVSAFLFAVMPLSVVMSVFSDGTTMAILSLLFVLASLFVLRAMKALEAAESRNIKTVLNKDVLKYVIGASLVFSAIILSWKEFSMIIVLLVFMMVGHAIISRLTDHEFGSVFGAYGIMILLTLVITAPYYFATGLFSQVYTGPLLLALIALIATGSFYYVRNKSKLKSFLTPILALLAIFAVLYYITPNLFNDIVTGNMIYESALLADLLKSQHVGISRMASYYGWATVWMPFVMITYMFYKLNKEEPSESHLMTVLWITGTFILSWMSRDNAIMAGVMYSVAAASAIILLYRYVEMTDYFKSLKGGGWKASIKKFLRPEPFVTLMSVAFLVIAPNAMLLADATTSSNQDRGGYLGGVSYTVDTDDNNPMNMLWDDYFDVDKNGALATWFENSSKAVDRGNFVSVTSDSGQGATAVSNILLAEGSAGAVSAMITRMIIADGIDKYEDLLEPDFVVKLNKIIDNPSDTKKDVLKDQESYPGIESDLDKDNAVYLASVNLITTEMTEVEIHQVYKEIRDRSNGAISYIALNANMIPVMQRDGTLFPTLAYMNDYAIDSNGAVPKYYEHGYAINYTDAMFESFIWKSLIGINNETGIGMNVAASLIYSNGSVAAIPGLGLSGFEVDYWKVKYNPDEDATLSSDGWEYLNGYEAVEKQKKEGGLINYFSSLIVMKVSDGYEAEDGTVTFDGQPLEGAKVAVFEKDPNGILTQRSTAFTDEDGNYSVLVPSGPDDYELRVYVATDKTVGGTYLKYQSHDQTNFANFDITPSTVKGSVEGEIGDLTVEIENLHTEYKRIASVSGGAYEIADLPPGKYAVSLRLNGKEIDSANITAYPGTNSGIDFDLYSNLKITVKDIYGAPFDGKTVIVENIYDGSKIERVSDENGLAEVKVLPVYSGIDNTGKYIVYAKDDISNASDVTVRGASTTTDVTIFDTVTEDVLTDLTGIENITVMAPGYSSYNQSGVDLPDIGDVTYTLIYDDSSKVRTYSIVNGLGAVTDTVEFNAELKSKSDTPIRGSITFYGEEGITDGMTFTYTSDDEGNVSAKLPAGKYTVLAVGKNGTAAIDKNVEIPTTTPEDPVVFNTDEGRTLKTAFTFNSRVDGTKGVPFTKVIVDIEYDGQEYTVYSTTDASGNASVTIPKDADATVSIEDGVIGELNWEDLSKDVGRDKSADFRVSVADIASPEFNLEDKWLWTSSKTDNTPRYFDEGEGDVKVTPGTYYLIEKNGTGYTYSKVKVYIGHGDFFTEVDSEVTGLHLVEVEVPEESTVSVETHPNTEEGKHYKVKFAKDDDSVYLMTEGEYLFKATEGTNISYKPILIPGDSLVEFTLVDKVTLEGYLGVSGDGFAIVEIDGIEIFTEVTKGSYSVDVPNIADNAVITVDPLKYKPKDSEYTYEYSGTFNVEIPDNPVDEDEPIVVVTNAYLNGDGEIVEMSDKLEVKTEIQSITSEGFELKLDVSPEEDSEGTKTYGVKAIGPWELVEAYTIEIIGDNDGTLVVEGKFSPTNVNDRDHKLKIALVNLEGKTVATGEIFNTFIPSADPVKKLEIFTDINEGAASDTLTDNEYMYAITFRNHDNDVMEVELTVPDLEDGWIYAVSDEVERYIITSESIDKKLTLAGNTKTVLYVKIMNSEDRPIDVPGIIADINVITGGVDVTLNGVDKDGNIKLELEPDAIELKSSLSIDGNNVYDTGNAMQPIFWVFTVLSIIMIVLIVWLGSRRGVFTRRK